MSVHEPAVHEAVRRRRRGGGFPPAALAEIAELRKRYPTAEALTLPALHIAQREWGGWLPDEAIAAVAAELDLPVAKVYGVVTFYDLYHQKPVGRHRIRVCTNLSCQLRGSEEIMEALHQELGVGRGRGDAGRPLLLRPLRVPRLLRHGADDDGGRRLPREPHPQPGAADR